MTKNSRLFKIYENLLYGVTLCADSEYAKQKRLEGGYTAVKRNVVVIWAKLHFISNHHS